MEQRVVFHEGSVPAWPDVRALLERQRFPVQVRMIDNELSFPDEEPPATWGELRLGTPQGMITVRRGPNRVTFVVWGNAEPGLLQARNALAWAFAAAADGRVETPDGEQAPDAFLRGADLPAGWPNS